MTIYRDADEAESDTRSDAAVNVMTPIVGKDPAAVAALEPPLVELTDSEKEYAGAPALFGTPAWEAVRMTVTTERLTHATPGDRRGRQDNDPHSLGGDVQIADPTPAE